jgi:hypothetical protein
MQLAYQVKNQCIVRHNGSLVLIFGDKMALLGFLTLFSSTSSDKKSLS